MKLSNESFRLFLIFGLIVLIPSCAVNPVTGKKQLMLMTEQQEVALGAQYHPSVLSTFGEYNDSPELSGFITEKGTEIGKISHRSNLDYHFKILDSPVINAFAVPGGYVYFTRGILAQFNNEAELIGVLGHEIGHITARHSVSQQSKQQLGQLLLMGGMIASEKFREFGMYAMQGMELLFLKFSRDNEREADRLGVEYTSKIGYDANEMANFFDVLNKMQMESEHGGVPTFMSTHPDPGERYKAVKLKSKVWQDSLQRTDWVVNSDSYLRMIDGLVYGEDPRQGFVENDFFYHPGMKFKYPVPGNWQVQNSPIQVQMAPKDGNALMIFTQAPQKTLEEAGQKTLQDLNLTVLDSKRTSVNGFPAIAAISQQVSQNQQTGEQLVIKVMSYLIDYNNMILVFHGVASDSNFNTYYRTFEYTMSNFDKLTDPAKLNVQAQRIKIVEAHKTTTLAEIFNSYRIQESMLEELALLNNIELNERIEKGKLIKVVSN